MPLALPAPENRCETGDSRLKKTLIIVKFRYQAPGISLYEPHLTIMTSQPNDSAPRTGRKLNDLLCLDNFVDKVVLAVSANEGDLTAINPDDAGSGISIGIRQWNQKAGELPDLLRGWHAKFPQRFAEIFQNYKDNLLNEQWVRSANMKDDTALMGYIAVALHDPQFQQEQVDLSRAFVLSTAPLAKKYGFSSELGLALIADLVNQKGRSGAETVLRRCNLEPAKTLLDEAESIELVSANSNRAGAARRLQQLKTRFSACRPAQ